MGKSASQTVAAEFGQAQQIQALESAYFEAIRANPQKSCAV